MKEGSVADCLICLGTLNKSPSSSSSSSSSPLHSFIALPCEHRFHEACLDELREMGVQHLCPLCRVKLPASAQKLFDDGASLALPLQKTAQRSEKDGRWLLKTRWEHEKVAEVLRLWEKAVEVGGHNVARFNLGLMYEFGKGVKRDFEAAKEWYEAAAKDGLADAQCYLGLMYAEGKGVPQSDSDACKECIPVLFIPIEIELTRPSLRSPPPTDEWVRMAAKGGYIPAQCNLGMMYERGMGCEPNVKKAIKWHRMAAM
jgi:hypothetical protein